MTAVTAPIFIKATFKSDDIAAAISAEARISFKLRPMAIKLSSIRGPRVFFDISQTVYGRKSVRFLA